MTELPLVSSAEELRFARENLHAARVLVGAGLHRYAVGRSYYAIFHAACALIGSIGLRARTHEGLRTLVNEHFVRPGRLGIEHARAFRQTAGDRSDADYDASATFAEIDSDAAIERADAFIVAVESLISSAGS